jgi:hypothetical protein
MSDPEREEGESPSAEAEGEVVASSTDEAPAQPEAEVAAAPKKKKKKKAAPAEPALEDPRVREIEAMFVAGDFAKTRELANAMLGDSDPRIVDVGRDYLHRTGVDPIQLAFLGACAAALIAIAWIYIPH